MLGEIPEASSPELPGAAIVCLRDYLWEPDVLVCNEGIGLLSF